MNEYSQDCELIPFIVESENERPDSKLESKFLFMDRLMSDEKIGIAIFEAKDFKLLKANQTYLNYLPKPFNTEETSYEKPLREIIPEFKNERGEGEWRRIVEQNQSIYVTELKGLLLGTDDRYWDNTITPIVEDGQVRYVVSMLQDVTERVLSREHIRERTKMIEYQKIELEKALAMKDELISSITHEFKTPLNVIYSAIQLIEYVYIKQIPERVKGLVRSIKQNTFRQLRLVNNMLDLTRLKSGRLKLNVKNIDIVFLTRVITESVKLYSDQKKITLIFKADLSSSRLAIDDEKYERIILNLLSNAIKFTPEGGKITVCVKENKKDKLVYVIVSDTGIGIPKQKKEMIFERFGQVESELSRQAEGTGIGLSLVKLLVEILEGSIKVDSELGVGSTFTVAFPIKECIECEEKHASLNEDTRLVAAIDVEFSDIYL